jgi:tetratricopeptide (TPR) repeat protein
LARGSAALYLLAARAYERGGETNQARDALRVALAAQTPAASIRLKVAALQLDLGCFDEARAIYEELLDSGETALPAREALGRLCLWTGDLQGALAHAERLAALDRDGTAAPRITAAVMVLQQNHAPAVSSLDRVLSKDPRDGEAYLWRAEAQLFLGRNQAALRDALRSVECGYSFGAAALHLLAGLVRARRRLWPRPRRKASPVDGDPCARYSEFLGYTPSGMIHDRWQRLVHPKREHGAVTHARRELAAEITEICADAAAVLAKNDARALIALLERSLAALSGNRTPLGTWVRPDGTLARLPRSVSARVRSRQVMELIRVAPADEVLRCFDELLARFPDSSMPLVHRGELQLWLGRYAEARADLEGAIAVLRQTRWAWYGLACLDLLAGDAERALATCALGIRVMHNTEGPVAFLYRGEAYRLLRRFDAAREQLQHSCALNPTRLSSWINLALVHSAGGGRAAQADIFRRLVHVAPGLMSEAARGLGEETFNAIVLEGYLHDHWPAGGSDGERMDRVLQQALTMMRGNRSSSCITYFTGDGQLCHVPLPGTEKRLGVDTEGKTLVQLRDLVKQALADPAVRESKG